MYCRLFQSVFGSKQPYDDTTQNSNSFMVNVKRVCICRDKRWHSSLFAFVWIQMWQATLTDRAIALAIAEIASAAATTKSIAFARIESKLSNKQIVTCACKCDDFFLFFFCEQFIPVVETIPGCACVICIQCWYSTDKTTNSVFAEHYYDSVNASHCINTCELNTIVSC